MATSIAKPAGMGNQVVVDRELVDLVGHEAIRRILAAIKVEALSLADTGGKVLPELEFRPAKPGRTWPEFVAAHCGRRRRV